MKVIDAEGRLFGKVNVFDAAVGAFVVVLLPLTYAAVLLFRPPTPRITAVESAPLTMAEDRAAGGSQLAGKLKVRGTGLRPVLRATIGDQDALAYIFESPSSADVLFGDIHPGVHDLVLYDGVQELARAPKAVTIPEKPFSGETRVHAVGVFMDLDQDTARGLQPGAKYPNGERSDIEIAALGDPEPARYLVNGRSEVNVGGRWQRPSMILVRCQISLLQPQECRYSGTLVAPGQTLAVPGSAGGLRMAIEEVVPDSPPVITEARVRFIAYPSVLDLMKAGDADKAQWRLDGRGAVIASVGARRSVSGQVSVGLMEEGGGPSAGIEAADQVGALDAVVRFGLDSSRAGWRYRTDIVRVGAPMTFSTATYTVRGVVLSLTRP